MRKFIAALATLVVVVGIVAASAGSATARRAPVCDIAQTPTLVSLTCFHLDRAASYASSAMFRTFDTTGGKNIGLSVQPVGNDGSIRFVIATSDREPGVIVWWIHAEGPFNTPPPLVRGRLAFATSFIF